MGSGQYLTQVNVRAASAVAERVGEALGVALPLDPNTVHTRGERSALWLGPDEWLVIDMPGHAAEVFVASDDSRPDRRRRGGDPEVVFVERGACSLARQLESGVMIGRVDRAHLPAWH